MFYEIIAVIIALVILIISADTLVKYASSLAGTLGVTPFLIGVVIIGFGTSAPEMFVSVLASMEGKGGLAIGNALGSNIANIGLVLGCAGIFGSVVMTKRITNLELPIVFLFTGIAAALLFDGVLSKLDGIIMFALLVFYLIWSAKQNSSNDESESETEEDCSLTKSIIWTVISLVLLIASSRLLVWGATGIATHFGVSDLIIGLTIVAIGTSLPELAAAIAAVKQKASSMIIGNIIGSNVFNTLGVLGLAGMVQETPVDKTVLIRDFPILVGLMILLWVFVLPKKKLAAWQSGLLLLSYISYLVYLASQSMR